MITIYIPGLPQKSYEYRRGDAQIIHDDKGNAIVIDGGESDLYNKLISYCKSKKITHVTYILTHWHIDHDTGMKAFLDVSGICVDKIYCPPPSELAGLKEDGASDDRARANRRISQAENLGKSIVYPAAGKDYWITVGEIRCVIWRRTANKNDQKDRQINNTSMQTYFPDLYYLSGGDMIDKADFLNSHKTIKVVTYKGYHHGNGDGENDTKTIHSMGALFYWYNDWEPKGCAIGGTNFSKWGAGKAKNIIPTVVRTDSDIIMTAANKVLRIQKGTAAWNFPIPYNGGCKEGWYTDGKNWWYQYANGKYATGWAELAWSKGKDWFYFNPDNGIMLTGWFYDSKYKAWYYLDPSTGAMVHGKPVKDNGSWYFLADDGKMRTGWYTEPGVGLHYLEPVSGKNQGHMYVNCTATIDGKDWLFDGYGIATELGSDVVMRVIHIAENEIGYKEKASNKDLDSKTANAGSANYTKYGRDMHSVYPKTMDFPAAWCDAFVDWCFYKAFGAETAQKMLCGNFDDYTVNSAAMYKKAGRWYTSPVIGDQIFFKDKNGICHTGLVYRVYNGKVYTIEGNKSNEVKYCGYALNDSYIAGYGRPKWELAGGGTPVPKTIAEIAQEVIDGKWGNGTTRKELLEAAGYNYAEVQKKVNEMLKH